VARKNRAVFSRTDSHTRDRLHSVFMTSGRRTRGYRAGPRRHRASDGRRPARRQHWLSHALVPPGPRQPPRTLSLFLPARGRPTGEGDSRRCAFARATDAVRAAAAIQQALHVQPWAQPAALNVRIGLHTGDADLRDKDYCGFASVAVPTLRCQNGR
jgi:hypothetical protein